MVWPFSSSTGSEETAAPQPRRSSERISKVEPTLEPRQQQPLIKESSPANDKPHLLLEETEPRFNNGPNNPQASPPIKQAVEKIGLSSFTFANLTSIACFREAGLTGLSAMFVLGSVIFLTQKSVTRATNWSIAGLLLGSTVSWEQCRSKRRRELEFTQRARDLVATKEKSMVSDKEIPEDVKEKRQEVSSWWKR